MNGVGILGLVLILTVLVALSGWRPEEARPASETRLMTAARVTLVLVAVLWTVFFWSEG